MNKRISLALLAALIACAPPAQAQPKLVEKIKKEGNKIVIPYEKYVLPNGLTVVIHEDHSDPLVHVDVTYHVGSAREEIGKSGFAHFFEHMMFQGSDNVADEQHFKIITEAGGTLNGTTNRDRTNYFETVPNNQLEKMLWLEADRMGFLLDAVTQKKFEVQRATVKNERGQRYDNVPYGLVGEVTAKNLYPYGHPYSWLTIGYIEDLNRVNVDDLKNFFLRWYGPNNATVTVGGDVNPQQVLQLVSKYFGSIPRGPEVVPVQVPAPVLDFDRYVSMMDNYAKLPMLRITYPTVPVNHPDEYAIDCLAEILGQGKNSYFYKKFVKEQLAVNASVSQSNTELAGEFSMSITPFPGKKLVDMKTTVTQVLADFEKNGISDDDIAKYRNSREADIINGLESVSGKVSQLAANQTFRGNPNMIGSDLARVQAVTKEDVMRVYNKYIKGKYALYLSVLTKGQEDNLAGADNYAPSTGGYKAPDYGYAGLKYNKAKDDFDRSKIPTATGNPMVKVPDFWKKDLASNIKVIGTKTDEIPVVNISISIKGGKLTDAANPAKAGVANMFAAMMEEDTKNYTAEAFSVELDKLGSTIDIGCDVDAIQINIRTLAKNLDKTIALAEERILNPVFTQEAFDRIKKRTLESMKNSANRPTYIASTLFGGIQFGKNSVLGWPTSGTESTINNIQLADIKNYYQNNFNKDNAEICVVGDIAEQNAIKKLEFVQKVKAGVVALPATPDVATPAKTTIYFVNVPGAAQTEFRIGYVTNMKYDALGDFYRAGIMNYPFGGAFNSRLNLDLREDKGWTYGARGGFGGNKYTGTYTFSSGIKANATDSALTDFLNILKEYKAKGVTKEELAFTQMSMGQSEAREYELGYQKANFLSNIQENNLPADFPKKQNDILNKMTVEDVNKVAAQYLPNAAKMNILLVGDKAMVWDGIKKLGYDVVELDKDGNVVTQ
jgi:Predicted Zn-dependent peptidases